MALQGKITATRRIQSAGTSSKTILAKHISVMGNTASLSSLTDVDTSARADGSLIQWDAGSSTFKVKGTIEHENVLIIGGSF